MPTLLPHQPESVAFLRSGARRYLADDPGMGKTVSALASLDAGARTCVVAPASALVTWRVESERWAPTGVDLVSYDRLRLSGPPASGYDVVILDEAHYLKSGAAKRTKAALRLAREAPRCILLSATPAPNGDPAELWPVFRDLWPELVRERGVTTLAKWRARYGVYWDGPWGLKFRRLNPDTVDEFRALLRRVMLRRRADLLGLPPIRVSLHYVEGVNLPDEVDGQPTSTARRLLGRAKAGPVGRVLREELRAGTYPKIVVMVHHLDTLAELSQCLAPFGVVTLSGATGAADRERVVQRFQRDPKTRVFIGQQTAAGVSLNLQVSSQIVLVEPSWVPGENVQAIRRVYRIGSTTSVHARVFAVSGTLDVPLMQDVQRKLESIRGAGL